MISFFVESVCACALFKLILNEIMIFVIKILHVCGHIFHNSWVRVKSLRMDKVIFFSKAKIFEKEVIIT